MFERGDRLAYLDGAGHSVPLSMAAFFFLAADANGAGRPVPLSMAAFFI